MKEFEKWFNTLEGENGWNWESRTPFELAKDSWKAALEWTLTQQGQIDWRFSPVILPKYIEEELNAKT